MAIRLDHGEDELTEVHDINVTPFIDVMLVLLIIFMVAAPLATVDVPVDLPSSNAQQQPRPDKPIYLTIKADGTLAIGDDPVTREHACGGTRRRDWIQQGQAHFLARRSCGAIRRRHAGAQRSARRELPQNRPGRARSTQRPMTSSALHWFDDDPHARRRWIISGVAVFCGYAAVAGGLLLWWPQSRPARRRFVRHFARAGADRQHCRRQADGRRTGARGNGRAERDAGAAGQTAGAAEGRGTAAARPAPSTIALPEEKKPPDKVEEHGRRPRSRRPRSRAARRGSSRRGKAGFFASCSSPSTIRAGARARRAGRGHACLQHRPQRPRAVAAHRARLRLRRTRRRGVGAGRARATDAGVPAEHDRSATRSDGSDPLLAALRRANFSPPLWRQTICRIHTGVLHAHQTNPDLIRRQENAGGVRGRGHQEQMVGGHFYRR